MTKTTSEEAKKTLALTYLEDAERAHSMGDTELCTRFRRNAQALLRQLREYENQQSQNG